MTTAPLTAEELGLTADDFPGVPPEVLQEALELERKKARCVLREDFAHAEHLKHAVTAARARAEELRSEARLLALPLSSPARIVTSNHSKLTPGSHGPTRANERFNASKLRSARAVLAMKVVLVGEPEAGKSCFCERFLHRRWEPDAGRKKHPCFAKRSVTLEDGMEHTVVLWDSPGVRTLKALPALYYKDADAIAVLFDACAGAGGAEGN